MSRVTTRLVTAALVLGSSALGFLPLAHADTTSTLTPSAEAWYQPNPTCGAPGGCVSTDALPAQPPAAPPTSPYPAGTLHIGLAAGQETARSYLALGLSSVFGTISAATLDVPLDTAVADGSQSPETATLQACLFSGTITPANGSIATPPKAACDSSAAVSYVATPAPHLHADLSPLLPGLASASGIVLLPDTTKAAQTDAWRVVFSAHTRTDAAKTAPAAVTLSVADQVTDGGSLEQPAVPPVVAPPIGTGFAPAPSLQLPEQTVMQPTVVPPITTGLQPVAQPRIITVGYAYPTVWLLPLAFLLLVPAATKALTKDLTPSG